ncbi:Lrp/AsnC family transcriptional regulator [Hahella sp. SMD15-11]|uniref:Lrp/AsnC family transcriptional regulator n=1 Tax=Thermohahella caldifontis TaxID=3142973 RepID=A0AB39UVY6_9GAMM
MSILNDPVTERLLALLEQDARAPTAVLARKLGLSRTAVHERIQKLVREGVIERFTIRRGDGHAARLIQAEVMIRINPKMNAQVVAALHRIEAVRALYTINGQFDLIARVAAATPEAIDQVLDQIGVIDGIEKTLSSIVLSTKFER